MIITVDMIMSKNQCEGYDKEKVLKLIGEGKTLLQLLDFDIPPRNRIWVVTKFLDDKTNRAFAIWCARQCKTDVEEITEYIDVIEGYYNGKATKEELGKADSAAYWVADSAAYWAADWAACSAADRKKQIEKLRQMVDAANKEGK